MPGVNLTNMTPIRSWEEAQTHWEANRPTRARVRWPAHSVALDGPRKPHVRLKFDSSLYQFSCMLYDTPLVTYYLGGRINVLLDARQASIDFLRKTLPAGIDLIRVAGEIWLEFRQPNGEKVHARHFTPAGVLLEPGILGTWATSGPVHHREVVMVQHRKIASIEKRCAPVKEWLRTVRRLAGSDEFVSVSLGNPPQHLEAALDDRQEWGRFIDYAPEDVVAAVAASSGLVRIVDPGKSDVGRTHPINSQWSRRLRPIAAYTEMAFL